MAERNTTIRGSQIMAAAAGDGLLKDASENFGVDVSDFAGTGLEDDGSENLRIAAAAAGDGLTGGAGSALAVGAGDGIDVSADAVAVDVTDFIDTAAGLTETANDIQVNLEASGGLDFATGAIGVDVTDFIDTAAGLKETTNDIQVNLEADGAISFDGVNGGLEVNVDASTIEIATNALQVKDLGITNGKIADDTIAEVKLDISNAPSDGYYLQYLTASGMTWSDVAGGYVELSDLIANEIPTGTINGVNTDFTLANTPATGTLQVYLNGLLQEPGSGKDYQLSGAVITFAAAPETGDIILCNYCKAVA